MMPLSTLFDALLAALLVALAWGALSSRDLFRSIVLFMIFGILSAMAWARLDAPDIALAEAAIGAGLTGILLLDTLGALGERNRPGAGPVRETDAFAGWGRWLTLRNAVLGASVFGAGVAAAAAASGLTDGEGLAAAVAESIGEAGVSNPVTAVLLNFRGYDTLLEVGVMLLAVIGVLSLRATAKAPASPAGPLDPQLSAYGRLMAPVMVLVAGYLLYAGAHAPGGAFQAGAVLGGALVLLGLCGFTPPGRLQAANRGLLVLGFCVFLLAAVALTAAGYSLLEYPAGRAGLWIFWIEAAIGLSTAFLLAELVSSRVPGGRP